jgi:DDE superfamily endonuclease
MSTVPIPPILSLLIGHIAAAVPRRARITVTELLIGAAATRGGHVTDAILAAGLSRSWTTYYWLLQRGRWTWLAVWQALLSALKMLFDPPVWHVVLDDTLVERMSARAPGSLIHYNHTAKPNRPRFLRGQGWLCRAAVVEHEGKVGAVPLMLRLVRRGPNRGKLKSAGFLLRLLGNRLGRVRVLLDAWFMRAWLIERTLAASHTVIGRVRRDLALYEVMRFQSRLGRGVADGPASTARG